MNAARWDALEVLFERIESTPELERQVLLDEVRRSDADLYAELVSLLVVQGEAHAFFNSLADAVLPSALLDVKRRGEPDPYGLVGRTVSHYRVLEPIGGGGMGFVYRAEDPVLRRTVALKFLPAGWGSNADAKARFLHEAQAASALDHPNVCTIYEVGETAEGQLFIAMGYYPGETLREKIARGPLPVDEALNYATQIAEGLDAAHARGIVHRDVKPANMIVTPEGTVKLIDFGLAKLADRTQITKAGVAIGTVAYMSPEQLRGDPVDHRTDIWAVGVVLHEMLTGERPFQAENEQGLIYNILQQRPRPVDGSRFADLPGIEGVLSRCLEKDPAVRYGSMAELQSALGPLVRAHGLGTISVRSRSGISRRQTSVYRASAAGLVLVTLVIGGITSFIKADRTEAAMAMLGTQDGEAYSSYVKGAAYLRDYLDRENVEAAIDLLARAVERDSLFALAHADLGEAYWRNYYHTSDTLWVNRALEHAVRARQIRPELAATFVTLGLVSRGKGKANQAITEFKRAISLDSTSAEAYRELGRAYADLNAFEPAELAFTHAIALEPEYWASYLGLGGLYYNRGQYEGAVVQFKKAEAYLGESALVYSNLGAALFELENFSEAKHYFELAIRHEPAGWIYSNLGTMYYYEANFEKAAEAFEQALRFDGGDYQVLGFLASAYEQIPQQQEKVESTYKMAIEEAEAQRGINERDPILLIELSTYYQQVGDSSQARAFLDEALALTPGNVEIMAKAAQVYEVFGERDRAMEWVRKALENGKSAAVFQRMPGLKDLCATQEFRDLVGSIDAESKP